MASIPTSKLAAPHVLFGLFSLGIARMSSQDDVDEASYPKGYNCTPKMSGCETRSVLNGTL